MCHLAQLALAKWFIQLLNLILDFYSGICVGDSFSLTSIIHQFFTCFDSQFLVSFDIASLFTNVPLDSLFTNVPICFVVYKCFSFFRCLLMFLFCFVCLLMSLLFRCLYI